MGTFGFTAGLLLRTATVNAKPLGSAFTYQGQLNVSRVPANGDYDLQFTLGSAATGNRCASPPITEPAMAIVAGLINISVDFTDVTYNGAALWVELAIWPAGPAGPQGPIGMTGPTRTTGATGAQVPPGPAGPPISLPSSGTSSSGSPSFNVQNTGAGAAIIAVGAGSGVAGAALQAQGTGIGSVITNSSTGAALLLGNNVAGSGGNLIREFVPAVVFLLDGHGNIASPAGASFAGGAGTGVYAAAAGAAGQNGAAGVWGDSHDYYGVWGMSVLTIGVAGTSANATGVAGASTSGSGVTGSSASGDGVNGNSSGGLGVRGTSVASFGIYGHSTLDNGVIGDPIGNSPVAGVAGFNVPKDYGVFGRGAGVGVFGFADDGSPGGMGVLGLGANTPAFSLTGGAEVKGVAGNPPISGVNYGHSDPGVWDIAATVPHNYFGGGDAVIAQGDFGSNEAKNFVEPHPTDPTEDIRYASLEGNVVGTYFRGTANLVHGRATMVVPADFRMVSAADGVTVQLTAIGHPANIYCTTRSLDGIEIGRSFDVEFDYQVNGVRKVFVDFPPIVPNRDFVPGSANDPLFTHGVSAESLRRVKANGTLNADG